MIESPRTPTAKTIKMPSGQRYIRIVLAAAAAVGDGEGVMTLAEVVAV